MNPGENDGYASTALGRVIAKDGGEELGPVGIIELGRVALFGHVKRIQINGRSRETPADDAAMTTEIISQLPSGGAKESRCQSAETICRVLSGDISPCRENKQRCFRLQSAEEGRAYHHFMNREHEQPLAKRPGAGQAVMMHASTKSFVHMEVSNELPTLADKTNATRLRTSWSSCPHRKKLLRRLVLSVIAK